MPFMDATYTPPSITAEHVVLTGPITGTVTLPDGRKVDVTAEVIAVPDEETANEVAHAIGQHWARDENVHPQQINIDPDTGTVEVRPFVYDDSQYRATKKRLDKQKGR